MVSVIDGKAFSENLVEDMAGYAAQIKEMTGEAPGLAVVLVGEDPASQVYVRNKGERTKAAGMRSIEHRLPEDTDEATLLALIDDLNNDDTIDGILVQLPLPDQIDADKVKAESGFVSDGGSPVKIQVSGSTVTFTVAGVGSSTLTLT